MKIAVIVQRAGKDFTGGSEAYALELAKQLSTFPDTRVDLLTTTARDHHTWKNAFPPGQEELSDTLTMIRFRVNRERGKSWDALYNYTEKQSGRSGGHRGNFYRSLPLGLAEEWLIAQGPWSTALLDYLEEEQDTYDRFIFLTYLYSTTYHGVDRIRDRNKVFIVPTFHDEPAAYLPVFLKYRSYRHLFLTEEEGNVARELIYNGSVPSALLGYGMPDRFGMDLSKVEAGLQTGGKPYILYAGRLEDGKGVRKLFKMFEQVAPDHPGLQLYTIGNGDLKDYRHERIHYQGFVSEEVKLALMKNAIALVHPSPFESLSIVLLEAFMMGVPGLVNGASRVLRDHIKLSGAGYHYEDESSFRHGLAALMAPRQKGNNPGEHGRRYFLENYSLESYRERIRQHIIDAPTGITPVAELRADPSAESPAAPG